MVLDWEYWQVRKCNVQLAALDLRSPSVMIPIAMSRDEHRGLTACVRTTSGLSVSFEFNAAVLFRAV